MRCYPDPFPDKDAHNAQPVLARHAQNSKPVITALTIIAGEHRESNAATIVSALEQHIAEGNAYQRLPAMYVLDSIVKNIGEPYTTLFGMNLHEVRDSTSLHRRAYVRGVFDAVLSLWPASSPISNRTLETDTNCPPCPVVPVNATPRRAPTRRTRGFSPSPIRGRRCTCRNSTTHGAGHFQRASCCR